MQKAVAGTGPIAPTVNVQLGEGVALTVTVGVGLGEEVTEGDAATVGVTDGLAPGVIVGETDGVETVGVITVRAVGVPQEDPSAPDGRVQGWTVQRTAPAQSVVAIAADARQMFGHGREQMNPLSGVAEHGLTRQVGKRPTQSCVAEACAA